MSQQLDHQQIRQLLNHSAARLDEPVLSGLRAARARAMEQHAAQHAHTLAVSGHGGRLGHGSFQQHRLSYWIAGLLLVASIVSGIAYWQQTSTDTSDEDIAILTDDLPLQVYVD
jgi:hypothetical protein